ncbi:hypothetical protein [Clostridium tagluense]|uniref:hypothetical protein n=1 Tax=Clostridium tagluense TaxID=360422 RepID=UPI001C6E7BEA|nr:hypothetical protein [Clostridium tagluense]MBW9158081.1 hypothetical protein [Clostridium tagluense]WLC65075.1 hypothetical protein KTC93_20000 [Clostridium tagluense]
MLILTIKIIAICAMLTFMFIGIWGFILLIKIYDQLRYKNYLMEKLIHNTSKLSLTHENIAQPKKDIETYDTFNLTEKEILDLNIKKDAI